MIEFAGYTRYWNNISADSQLPPISPEQTVNLSQAEKEKKQTQPPPRYSEPKLVQLMEKKGIGRPSTYAPTIKTLRSRSYVQSLKGKLQPTELGLSLDAALEKLLPDLIQPEFTAKMEADLDAIAAGKQDWQAYLTNWNKDYFSPAIDKARIQLPAVMKAALMESVARGENLGRSPKQSPEESFANQHFVQQRKSSKTTGNRKKAAASTATKDKQKRSKKVVRCPKCEQPMDKIPSRSKKLKANRFMRCSAPACDAVMFWNPKKKTYEQPYSQRPVDPTAFTDYPCPVCGALLVKHAYKKEGQEKVMLRCSIAQNRKGKCKDVAYFKGYNGFWSPKFGNLEMKSEKMKSAECSQ